MNTFKVGDLLEAVRNVPECQSAGWRYRWRHFPNDRIRKGERLVATAINESYVCYQNGLGSTSSIDYVHLRPVTRRVSTARILSLSLVTVFSGGLYMNSLFNDPLVHRAVTGLIAATSGLIGINLAWLTLVHIGHGFARWSDRRRNIRDTDTKNKVTQIIDTLKQTGKI